MHMCDVLGRPDRERRWEETPAGSGNYYHE